MGSELGVYRVCIGGVYGVYRVQCTSSNEGSIRVWMTGGLHFFISAP